jgi:hypothetical protein
MKLNSSSTYKNQDAFVLLLSKKAEELPKGLPKYVEEEIKLYIASENKGIEHRTVANKHFFFAKVQKTNEDYRLLGPYASSENGNLCFYQRKQGKQLPFCRRIVAFQLSIPEIQKRSRKRAICFGGS